MKKTISIAALIIVIVALSGCTQITPDNSDCVGIQDSFLRDNCYGQKAMELEDASLCGKIQEAGTQVGCYHTLARATKDISVCEGLSNQTSKEQCYSAVAAATQDLSICETLIELIDNKENCYLNVGLERGDDSLCEKVTVLARKDLCYDQIAKRKRDVTICTKIQELEKEESCHTIIAWETLNESDCEQIPTTEKKDTCYSGISARTGKSELCNKITEIEKRDSCYNHIAGIWNLESECDKIETQNTRDICYKEVARDKPDSAICSRITNQQIKEDCLAQFNTEPGECKENNECNDENPCTIDECNNGSCEYTNHEEGHICGRGEYAKACVNGRCLTQEMDDPTEFSLLLPTKEELEEQGFAVLSIYCRYVGHSMGSEYAYSCHYEADHAEEFYYFYAAAYEWDIANNPELEDNPEENYKIWEANTKGEIIKENSIGEKSLLYDDNISNVPYSHIRAKFLQNNVLAYAEIIKDSEDVKEKDYQIVEEIAQIISQKIG
ncbi:MAG: hypothetical protein JW772_01540 [Candidatus Diapherotrites archaeon]|nr:hypothetical protein [Candidatus Diapherotrites archaeon]